MSISARLAAKIRNEFRSLRVTIADCVITIMGLCNKVECDALILDIKSIIRDSFEGKIKDTEYYSNDCLQVVPIPETARIM